MIALTREVSPSISKCELTHLPRHDIDLEIAQSQHHDYEDTLRHMGCEIRRLPEEPNLPDSVFVEDTAVVIKELAIIARMGAESRRDETKAVAALLREYRKLCHMESPGTLDGGDVLQIGNTIYVGRSRRTNKSGITQLIEFISPYQYEVVTVPVEGCLHLKSAVTRIGEDTLLINKSWVDPQAFEGMGLIDIDPEEPYAANALLLGGQLMYPSNFPKTLQRLQQKGIAVIEVNVSELQKAEGALTCCSLIYEI